MLRKADAILFDFDGPICDFFNGLPAAGVAADLINFLRGLGVRLPNRVEPVSNPLEVLRLVTEFDRETVTMAEDRFRSAELVAARRATPTPGGAESIRACAFAGKTAAIVSNNSAEAVRLYLDIHRMRTYVDTVVGRPYADTTKMKPNPDPVRRALVHLGAEPSVAVLVGDSLSDIQASRAAGTCCIGFANKPQKWHRLSDADLIIDDMAELAAALRQIALS